MCTAEPLRDGSFGAGVSIGLLAADGLRSPDAPTAYARHLVACARRLAACARCFGSSRTTFRRLMFGAPMTCVRRSGGLCTMLRWLVYDAPWRSRCGVPLLMHAVVAAFACRLCGFPKPCRRFRMSALRTGKRRRCFRVPALQRSGGAPIGGQPCPCPNNAFKTI